MGPEESTGRRTLKNDGFPRQGPQRKCHGLLLQAHKKRAHSDCQEDAEHTIHRITNKCKCINRVTFHLFIFVLSNTFRK